MALCSSAPRPPRAGGGRDARGGEGDGGGRGCDGGGREGEGGGREGCPEVKEYMLLPHHQLVDYLRVVIDI